MASRAGRGPEPRCLTTPIITCRTYRKALSALLAIVLIAAAPSQALLAAATGTIEGTLVDATGMPLAGYTVRVKTAGGVSYDSAPTGPDGRFEIKNLPGGTYTYVILDPEGNLIGVRIPPVELAEGTSVTQPIAIIPAEDGRRIATWIPWTAGAAGSILLIALINANDDDDEEPSMTPGGP